MTPAREDMAQIASNGTALALTTALLAVMFATRSESWRDSPALAAGTSEPGIEVTLQPATAEAPPAPQAPPPVPRKVPLHRMTPQPAAVAQLPVPAELQTMPAEREPMPEGGALVASGAPASAAPTTDFRPDLEAQYAAGLRTDIDRRTHPPDSAQYRLHRPSGEVRVEFVVTRNGEPKGVRVRRSSGSAILDEAAVAIVSSGHYPPMPTQVFAGEAEHVFGVTIEFRAAVS